MPPRSTPLQGARADPLIKTDQDVLRKEQQRVLLTCGTHQEHAASSPVTVHVRRVSAGSLDEESGRPKEQQHKHSIPPKQTQGHSTEGHMAPWPYLAPCQLGRSVSLSSSSSSSSSPEALVAPGTAYSPSPVPPRASSPSPSPRPCQSIAQSVELVYA